MAASDPSDEDPLSRREGLALSRLALRLSFPIRADAFPFVRKRWQDLKEQLDSAITLAEKLDPMGLPFARGDLKKMLTSALFDCTNLLRHGPVGADPSVPPEFAVVDKEIALWFARSLRSEIEEPPSDEKFLASVQSFYQDGIKKIDELEAPAIGGGWGCLFRSRHGSS